MFEYTIDRKFEIESIISIESWQSNKYFQQPISIDLRIGPMDLLSVSGVYIRKRLFYPPLYCYCLTLELIVWVCYVNCVCVCCVFTYWRWVFGNFDTMRVFPTLGAILLFVFLIVLALLSGYLTECRIVSMCIHFMSFLHIVIGYLAMLVREKYFVC